MGNVGLAIRVPLSAVEDVIGAEMGQRGAQRLRHAGKGFHGHGVHREAALDFVLAVVDAMERRRIDQAVRTKVASLALDRAHVADIGLGMR
jgi:hypothetical protein